MPIPEYRLFFDTSVYIAALLSPEGGAGELIRLAESGAIRMVVSEEVIIEIDRVLSNKFPLRVQRSRELLKSLAPEIAPQPGSAEIKPFLHKLDKSDAAILCAASLAQVAAFVTWNTRDFMSPAMGLLVDFPVVVPAEALKLFRKWIDPFLD